MITVLTIEAVLQHTCAVFRERADRGEITAAERDLLVDGAILLAMHLDDLACQGLADPPPWSPEAPQPHPAGRHERYPAAAAA